jgi:hypothetical protein
MRNTQEIQHPNRVPLLGRCEGFVTSVKNVARIAVLLLIAAGSYAFLVKHHAG